MDRKTDQKSSNGQMEKDRHRETDGQMDRSIGRLSDGQMDKLDQIDRWKYRQRDRKKGVKRKI